MSQSIFKTVFGGASVDATLNGRKEKTQTPSLTKTPRMFLVDDDPIFCKLMERTAKQTGDHLESFNSLTQLGDSDLSGFDVGIVDFDLGCVDGVELAAYIENQLGRIPLVFISSTDRRKELIARRESGQAKFISKLDGPSKILEMAKISFNS